MRMDIKLSCIAQHKEPTLNVADSTYALFKQDALRTSAQMSCDIEVADGLYSVDVAYGEAVSTSYVYVNKGKAISVDVPVYILNYRATDVQLGCVDDLLVRAVNMVNKFTSVQPYSHSLTNTLENMQLPDGLYGAVIAKGNLTSPFVPTINRSAVIRAHVINICSGNVRYLTLTQRA